MERLSHDLNLALEESNYCRQERRKLGFRRRTRSAGNLQSAVTVSLVEDGSSSSPPQAPVITQPLSDSDDLQPNLPTSNTSRQYREIVNVESDSVNENFSPTRPANTKRKRKLKKMVVGYANGKRSPPIELLSAAIETNASSTSAQSHELAPLLHINNNLKERNVFCGKRKWSHRDKTDVCEMRERSFSGGCSSKSTFFKTDIKCKKYDSKKSTTDSVIQPTKFFLKSPNTNSLDSMSSFNFIYKNTNNGSIPLPKVYGNQMATGIPSFFSSNERKYKKNIGGPFNKDSNSKMDCTENESSSLSSSESDGVVTNDSDREGDDELTDWPGIEELKQFNKNLSLKSSKANNSLTKSKSAMPPTKRCKKENVGVNSVLTGFKNRFKKKKAKVDSENDDDANMSDSKTVVDLGDPVTKSNRDHIQRLQPHSSFLTFSDVKNAGISGQNADESFFQSFQAFQEKEQQNEENINQILHMPPLLQKTSSSDLNLSEKSPQSDYCSENSMSNMNVTEVREIRAGCRRIRDERPGFLILSAANEQLSKFLQNSYQTALLLPCSQDPEEDKKLESLAKLYNLDLQYEMGRPLLMKTRKTMRVIQVEQSYSNSSSGHKRRCYGEDPDSGL